MLLDCVSNFNNLALAQNKTFIIDIDEPVELFADKDMMKRAIINSIDNAIKYSLSGNPIRINNGLDNGNTIIRIINTGNELSPELLSKLFDRFQRADDSRTTKGYGLGLPIIKAIIEAHGGKVVFTSVETVNTMNISIPILENNR
jgi:signal transduction histidine kinase